MYLTSVTNIQLDEAASNNDIDVLLDDPSKMSIINMSRWSATKPITLETRNELLHCLIYEEVIHKSESHLLQFRKGLDSLGVLRMLQHDPMKMCHLLVYRDAPVTVDTIKRHMKEVNPRDERQKEVAAWFFNYLDKCHTLSGNFSVH